MALAAAVAGREATSAASTSNAVSSVRSGPAGCSTLVKCLDFLGISEGLAGNFSFLFHREKDLHYCKRKQQDNNYTVEKRVASNGR